MVIDPDPITTSRLVLRSFRRRDADELLPAVTESMPELKPWLPWAHDGYSRIDANRFVKESIGAWRDGRAYDFTIRRPSDPNRHLGNVSIWHVSRHFRTAEIGYWVRSTETHQGIAAEGTAALLRLGFEEMNTHRIVLRIAVGNTASDRVAEKLGFIREGVLREELEVHGERLDHTVWSLLEHEYTARADDYGAMLTATSLPPT